MSKTTVIIFEGGDSRGKTTEMLAWQAFYEGLGIPTTYYKHNYPRTYAEFKRSTDELEMILKKWWKGKQNIVLVDRITQVSEHIYREAEGVAPRFSTSDVSGLDYLEYLAKRYSADVHLVVFTGDAISEVIPTKTNKPQDVVDTAVKYRDKIAQGYRDLVSRAEYHLDGNRTVAVWDMRMDVRSFEWIEHARETARNEIQNPHWELRREHYKKNNKVIIGSWEAKK